MSDAANATVDAAALVFVPSFLVTVCFVSLWTAVLGAVLIGASFFILGRRTGRTGRNRAAPDGSG